MQELGGQPHGYGHGGKSQSKKYSLLGNRKWQGQDGEIHIDGTSSTLQNAFLTCNGTADSSSPSPDAGTVPDHGIFRALVSVTHFISVPGVFVKASLFSCGEEEAHVSLTHTQAPLPSPIHLKEDTPLPIYKQHGYVQLKGDLKMSSSALMKP